MKKGVLFGLILVCFQWLSAQGLVLEDERYDELPRLTTLYGHKDADLPASVDLSDYCPSVRNQGDVYSCVGWAVGYGALTIKQAIKHQWRDRRRIDAQAYSAMFIYNQIKQGGCSGGARISDALELLRTQGDCLAGQFDVDIEDCNRQPHEHLAARVRLDTISDYLSLFSADANADFKTRRVVEALARDEPVIVGMAVRKNFYQLRGAKYWWPELGNRAPAGGHAMVVVGYDLASASLLLFNSWGEDWGTDGYIRVKFADFGRFCKYAFILQLSPADTSPETETDAPVYPLRTLNGSARLKNHAGTTDRGEPLFPNAALRHVGNGVYTSERGAWPLGQLFQLAARTEENGHYLYAFSIDARGTPHVHWPRAATLNENFRDLNESALLPDADTEVLIPGPAKALRLNERGTDVLYVFFADRPIRHPAFIIAKLRKVVTGHRAALETLLGKHLVPLSDLTFAPDRATFTAHTRGGGYIVPLVITLRAE